MTLSSRFLYRDLETNLSDSRNAVFEGDRKRVISHKNCVEDRRPKHIVSLIFIVFTVVKYLNVRARPLVVKYPPLWVNKS